MRQPNLCKIAQCAGGGSASLACRVGGPAASRLRNSPPWRLGLLAVILAATGGVLYLETSARNRAESVYNEFPLKHLLIKQQSLAFASEICRIAMAPTEGDFGSLTAIRLSAAITIKPECGVFQEAFSRGLREEVCRELRDRFGLSPDTSSEGIRCIWHGGVNAYVLEFSSDSSQISLRPVPHLDNFTTVSSFLARFEVRRVVPACVIALALFVLINLHEARQRGAFFFRPFTMPDLPLGSTSTSCAFFQTMGVCLTGWGVWQALLFLWPSDHQYATPGEAFVGPYQISVFHIQCYGPLVDPRAQRYGYYAIVALLGLLVLTRQFWFPLVNLLFPFLIKKWLGLLGILAICWICSDTPWRTVVPLTVLLATFVLFSLSHRPYLGTLLQVFCALTCFAMCGALPLFQASSPV